MLETQWRKGYAEALEDIDHNMLLNSGYRPIIFNEETTLGTQERINELWGNISNALLESAVTKKPYLLRLLDARSMYIDRLNRQDFARAHNLRLKSDGLPDKTAFQKAYRRSLELREAEKDEDSR